MRPKLHPSEKKTEMERSGTEVELSIHLPAFADLTGGKQVPGLGVEAEERMR